MRGDDFDRWCEWPGCEREAESQHHLCAMHLRRRQRGADMGAPVQERMSPSDRQLWAALGLANCDSEDDEEWRRWKRRLRDANRAAAAEKRDILATASSKYSYQSRGGMVRAEVLSPKRRQEIARRAIAARWARRKKETR